MFRLVLIFLFTGALLLGAQSARYPKIEITDVAAALYVTGWEVEKEIVIRPLALPLSLRAGVPEAGSMTAADREALKPLITEFFSRAFPVTINGEPTTFVPEGVKFIEPDTENLVEISATAPVSVEDFMIVIKYSAPLPSLDSTIAFTWNYFPEGVVKIPVRIADTLGTRLIEVQPTSGEIDAGVKLAMNLRNAPLPPPVPEITKAKTPWLTLGTAVLAVLLLIYKRWKSAIALGILAAIIWTFTSRKPGTAPVSPEQAVEITDRILENVYHAFNISDENAQYDQLETVLDGPALESTFLEVRRTTNQRSEDGSRVRVRNVTVKRASPQQEAGELEFTTSCQWETSGKIGHWGHFHNRTNLYSADISLAVSDGKWKATELNLNSRERE
jgi:hypothetical protein